MAGDPSLSSMKHQPQTDHHTGVKQGQKTKTHDIPGAQAGNRQQGQCPEGLVVSDPCLKKYKKADVVSAYRIRPITAANPPSKI